MSKLVTFALILICSQFVFADVANFLEPEQHEGYDLRDGKMYFRRGEAGLILENVGPQEIAKYYSDRGVNLGNPFSGLGGDTQPAAIFLLTILNRTNGNVTFTSRYVTLKIKTEAFFSMDFTDLLDFTEGQNKPIPEILENSVFHSSEIIRPGKIVSKFLIFPALPKKFDRLKLIFDYVFFEKNEVSMSFYFNRKKTVQQ